MADSPQGADVPGAVLLATRNVGKRRELRALVEAVGWRVVTLDELGVAEEPAEDALEVHDTFLENARAKAVYFAARAGSYAVLAEDSGLCVEALGGAPGVRSKRWSNRSELSGAALDAANCAHLLGALTGAASRRASYVCGAVLRWGDREVSALGETTGAILEAPCGGEGFGYDPYFWSTELAACFGAVDGAAKASVSHRGRAVRPVDRGGGSV
jgi:XTP/dITP diphosphohydrolase